MQFPERELKPYAEPVSATELREGSVYFMVTFIDNDMFVPVMETLVFIGKSAEGLLEFQDAESFHQKTHRESATRDSMGNIFQCSEEQLNGIFDYEHALDVLLRCSLRRQSADSLS
jgi:hypothetical protein